jgi:transcriptional regulator
MSDKLELPQGTLDLLILKAVALEPRHGWGISERLRQISSATLSIRQGSLYPALHRLERRGWVRARWGVSDNNRRAKFYELTRSGRAQLERDTDAWQRLAASVAQVLESE